jgi:hypothetical protein
MISEAIRDRIAGTDRSQASLTGARIYKVWRVTTIAGPDKSVSAMMMCMW